MKICPVCSTEYRDDVRFCPKDGQTLRSSGPTQDLVGQVLADRYHIMKKLGEGGMGQVFEALDTRLGRPVAIKTMPERFGSHFEREARTISSLNHPNICTLYDVGSNFLVMELVEGETLAARLKRGPLLIETVRQYGGQILAALAEAHSKGIVHRDLKPGNIMIGKSGIKVLDFGIATSAGDQTVTDSGKAMGTPAYMSPEQREGKPADGRSDIYSFGCVLYEMVTGARVGTQRRRISSPKLEKITTRCLEENPGRRWQSAVELERELSKAFTVRSRWYAISAAAAILAVVAVAYFYFRDAPKLTDKDTSSSPISSITPASRSSTERFVKGLRFSWNNRPFSKSWMTSRCGVSLG